MWHENARRGGAVVGVVGAVVIGAAIVAPNRSYAASGLASVAVPPIPVLIANTSTNPVPVTGTVKVSNLPVTQPVSGTVNVGNLPGVQKVEVTNLPTVGGSVEVSNFPAVQQVAGTVSVSETFHGIYQKTVTGTSDGATGGVAMTLPTPDRPVRTDVAIQLFVPSSNPPNVFLSTNLGDGSGWFEMTVPVTQTPGTQPGSLVYTARLGSPIYLSPGGTTMLQVHFSDPIPVVAALSFDGIYLA